MQIQDSYLRKFYQLHRGLRDAFGAPNFAIFMFPFSNLHLKFATGLYHCISFPDTYCLDAEVLQDQSAAPRAGLDQGISGCSRPGSPTWLTAMGASPWACSASVA